MKLYSLKSGGEVRWYISKSFRDDKGKSTSKIIEKLGTVEEIKKVCGDMDPMEWARERTRELTEADKQDKLLVKIEYDPEKNFDYNSRKIFNGGYLYLQKIYSMLGLNDICKDIQKRGKFQFNLNEILSSYVFSRILYPDSKKGTYEEKDKFLEHTDFQLEDVYRALSVLAREEDFIQSQLFKNSKKAFSRNTEVIYYDCSNYFFEIEKEDNLRKYGPSKEHRPNPIVQVGLFMDSDGIPLAFCINAGNTNEQITLRPLEEKLNKTFEIKQMIVCTDGGLSSMANRLYNSQNGRAFITVQSLKVLNKTYQDWALSPEGWRIYNTEWEKYDENDRTRRKFREKQPTFNLNDECVCISYHESLFIKERYIKDDDGFEQRLVVTFSFKYMEYLRSKRQRQIERAINSMSSGRAKAKSKGQNDINRFINHTHCTNDGEIAENEALSLNTNQITEEERFDGFYAIATNLTNAAEFVINKNSCRAEIEDLFRITKTDFSVRPVFLQREDRIRAHFIICFIALVIFKLLKNELRKLQGRPTWRRTKEDKKNKVKEEVTTDSLRETLTNLNFTMIKGIGYTPVYTGNTVIELLQEWAGINTGKELIPLGKMHEIIRLMKKS